MQTIGLDAATITYFLAGLIGSLARVLVGTTQGNWSRRTIADVAMGAIGGMVLPYVGLGFGTALGVDQAALATVPVIIKAGVVALAMYAGSHMFAAVLHRRELKADKENGP